MLMLWIPGGALVTALIGVTGYLARRHIERRREIEVLALLIQTADLCTKLQQSGTTLDDLHALQDEVLRRELKHSRQHCAFRLPGTLTSCPNRPALRMRSFAWLIERWHVTGAAGKVLLVDDALHPFLTLPL
jgi:hypothetical protein